MINQERKGIFLSPEETAEVYRSQTKRLIGLRKEIEKIKWDDIQPKYHSLASNFSGSLAEAETMIKRSLFGVWLGIRNLGNMKLMEEFDEQLEEMKSYIEVGEK